jgi:hypothetical protein
MIQCVYLICVVIRNSYELLGGENKASQGKNNEMLDELKEV